MCAEGGLGSPAAAGRAESVGLLVRPGWRRESLRKEAVFRNARCDARYDVQ